MTDIRYVMILEIEKIIRKSPKNEPYNRNTTTTTVSEDLRQKFDVAKIVISDTDLNRLLDRGTKHLALVQDEETEEDTKIGRPRA